MRQSYFARLCGISESYFSKLINGANPLSLKDIYMFAYVMKVDPAQLTSMGKSILDDEDSIPCCTGKDWIEEEITSFATNPESIQFKGVLGEYYFYSYPTIRTEQKRFLKGKLTLRAHKGKRKYCESILEIFTGKYDRRTKTPIVKEYRGNVVISVSTSSCFTMMYSKEYLDFCCLNWSHIYLNDDDLICRYAACLTTSAGVSHNRRPVMLKVLLSRNELSDVRLSELSGQLNMNSRTIEMNKSVFEQKIVPYFSETKEIAHLKRMARKEQVYIWDEKELRSIKKEQVAKDKVELLNLLRKYANGQSYIKVSGKAETLLFEYLQNGSRNESDDECCR